MNSLIPIAKAAALLGISRSKLYQLVERRAVPHIRFGARIVFNEAALEKWADEQIVQPAGRE
jgi:excisionase family DNA binding protein